MRKKTLLTNSIVLTSIIVIAMSLASCTEMKKQKIKDGIEQINKECPMDCGIMGHADSFEYDTESNTVKMSMVLNPQLGMNLSLIEKYQKEWKEETMDNYANDPNMTAFLKLLDEVGASMSVKISEETSGDNMTIDFDNTDIHNIVTGNIPPISPLEKLEYNAEMTKLQCPLQVDQVTTMTDVILEDNKFVYIYEIDEEQYDIDTFGEESDMIRENIKANMNSDDPTLSAFRKVVKNAGYDVAYRYIGNQSGTAYELIVECDELE